MKIFLTTLKKLCIYRFTVLIFILVSSFSFKLSAQSNNI